MDTRWLARVFSRPACRVLPMLLGGICAWPAGAAPPPEVTIYRCTDASGHVALRDSPCAPGTAQEVRTLQRPVDGPPPPPAAAVVAGAPDPPPPQVIVLRPPQPMYRCVRPDGSRYTSDSASGNPRWVPLWTLGYRPARGRPAPRIGVEAGDRRGSIDVDSGAGTRRPGRGVGYPAGTWIRDDCRQMPQGEVCGLLTQRRTEVRRRFFNAQPTERRRLSNEAREINARLSQDCAQ